MTRKFAWAPRPGFLFALTLAIGLGGGVILDRRVLSAFVPPGAVPPNAVGDFRLMAQAWNIIHRFYVGRSALEPRVLTYGAIGGMIDALGDTGHSAFLPPGMVRQVHQLAHGEFKGIGAEVQMKDGHVVIVAPIDGSPAQQASLRPGDIILKVDGKDISNLTLDEVVSRISGREGTSVALTILNPQDGRTREVSIVRASIRISNVTWQRLPETDVAHVRLTAFHQGITEQLRETLREVKQQSLRCIILDLRNNPGGLLEEAIGTASQFLSKGSVLLQRNAQGQVTRVPVKKGGLASEIPLVLLVNNGSASAAEIVAGALQDAQRAVLMGEKTFGAGTVLNEFRLSDGSAVLLAIEEWLTPAGHIIWHKGIMPNVTVPLSRELGPLFPQAERQMSFDDLRASGDTQLLRALETLTKQSAELKN